MNRTKRNIKPTSFFPILPQPYLSSKSFLVTFNSRPIDNSPRGYDFLEEDEKKGKNPRKENEGKKQSFFLYEEEEIYIYINIHRPLRNESKIRRGKWGRRGGIPLKKSSHPGVISVYSGMTRRIPSTRKKPVSSAPSRICLPACLPLPSRNSSARGRNYVGRNIEKVFYRKIQPA